MDTEELVLERPIDRLMPMQWRVYVFNKAGKAHRGINLYSSQQEAQDRIYDIESDLDAGKFNAIQTNDGTVPVADYHYCMPMPEMV